MFFKMTNCDYIAIVSFLSLAGRCWAMHHHDSEEEDTSTGLTMGQIAAMAIGGVVVLALIIIAIIAIILKCNKKSKPAIQPTHLHGVSELTPTQKFANPTPLYDEPPPKYSLRDEGPSFPAAIPPSSETYPTKRAL